MDAETAPRPFRSKSPIWFGDFDIGPTSILVRATGMRVKYSPSVFAEAIAWFRYFFAVKAAAARAPSFTIAFTPQRARPWYLIWPAARLAGAQLVKDAAAADVVMHFEDATYSPNEPPRTRAGARVLNYGCRDVSKSHVADVFERVFGYPLAIDPATHRGQAVEKSEINGAHDGRVVTCPMKPTPHRVYQRLVDSRGSDPRVVEDLRTPTVGGKPVCVYVKRRTLSHRFTNENFECEMVRVEQAFSAEEVARISAFVREMGMDWGGLDVLRDKGDGRIYIVDANKTDMGPPIALPFADKMRSTWMLADAFRALIAHDGGQDGR